MMYSVIHTCPVCEHLLHVKKLACSKCHTVVENNFSLSKFASLSEEQIAFIEVFVVNRGNIKEVEKALNISYPTVRSKLDNIIKQLGYGTDKDTKGNVDEEKTRKAHIIERLEKGEISAQEAVDLLKK